MTEMMCVENDNVNDFYTTYFHSERHHIVKKYDINTWFLYLYFLENKNLTQFYKSNSQILEDLDNSFCLNTLRKCKDNLIEAGILVEKENKKGGTRLFNFKRLKLNEIEQPHPNIEPP